MTEFLLQIMLQFPGFPLVSCLADSQGFSFVSVSPYAGERN